MSKRFFSYSPDIGFVLHDTQEAAKASAEAELKQCRKDAQFDGEWPREVEDIRWGEVMEATAEVPHEEGSCDYTLRALTPNVGIEPPGTCRLERRVRPVVTGAR